MSKTNADRAATARRIFATNPAICSSCAASTASQTEATASAADAPPAVS